VEAAPKTASAPPPQTEQAIKSAGNKSGETKQTEKNPGEKPFKSAFGDDRI
jgi:hypothetical protein